MKNVAKCPLFCNRLLTQVISHFYFLPFLSILHIIPVSLPCSLHESPYLSFVIMACKKARKIKPNGKPFFPTSSFYKKKTTEENSNLLQQALYPKVQ